MENVSKTTCWRLKMEQNRLKVNEALIKNYDEDSDDGYILK